MWAVVARARARLLLAGERRFLGLVSRREEGAAVGTRPFGPWRLPTYSSSSSSHLQHRCFCSDTDNGIESKDQKKRDTSDVPLEELTREELEELKQKSETLVLGFLKENGPSRRPKIWDALKDKLRFRSRAQFGKFLWYLHRKRVLRARPSATSNNRFDYQIVHPSKWQLAMESSEEPDFSRTTWQDLLTDVTKSEAEGNKEVAQVEELEGKH